MSVRMLRQALSPTGSGERDDLAHVALDALRRRVVTAPQHELTAARVRERPHLLRDLLDGADEVVARVRVEIAARAQRATTRRVQPRVEVALVVEQPAVGRVRAHDAVEVTADVVAVPAQHLRLVLEPVETDLPVRLVRVTRRDAQRHLFTTAAYPDLRQLL